MVSPPRSAEGHRARAGEQATGNRDNDRFQLAVEAVGTREMAGAIGSHQAEARSGWCEHGITIGAEHRCKGYAAEAAELLLRFMFAEHRFHKCQVRIFAHNEASLALHRRLGLVEESRLRELVYLSGRHRDVVVTGLLAEEFAQLHPTTT
ncbi:GNAT family N-acetyltransferase [Streptomyces sp. NPDC001194]|uniref:GNAT family N-acetyltransferase n=1 Tax=Streptomyces sp. NPDC001194 TaxID=3364547 RepID=UPI003676E614